jgi:hypothetical protein
MVAASAEAQRFGLEVTPVHCTVSYGWPAAAGTLRGLQAGFGFPQFDRQLLPSDGELIDFLHIGGFIRSDVSRALLVDSALRIGLAELRGCSGCLPGVLAAGSTGILVGGRRLKVGLRASKPVACTLPPNVGVGKQGEQLAQELAHPRNSEQCALEWELL